MSVPMFYNEITNQWEPIVTSDRLPIVDLGKNYDSDNLEGALQEIAKWKNDVGSGSLGLLGERMDKAENDIAWLKEHGGGGSGGGSVPVITSTIPEGKIKLEAGIPLDIPIVFSSGNLGEGIAYILLDNVEINTQTIKQGANTINIGAIDVLKATLSIYAKDRAGFVSNTLTWTVINGGIDLEVDFDYTADYIIGQEIIVPYYVTTSSTNPLTAKITVGYDNYEVTCINGYNDYTLPNLGVGVHHISFQITDGEYSSKKIEFDVIIVDSDSLYLTTDFDNGDQIYGTPISINYRVSYKNTDKFPLNLYLDDKLYKELTVSRGSYYWILNDRLDIGAHKYKIELVNGENRIVVEDQFNVVAGDYTPVDLAQNGLIFRLNPSSRTNNDDDRENPIINGYQANLYNFNFGSNGWINKELVCNTGAYVCIDFKPYLDNITSGSTIEVYFKAIDIGMDDALVVDYRDPDYDRGFKIELNKCTLESETHTNTNTFLTPGNYCKVSFVIDRRNKFAKIYVNGINSAAFMLTDSGSGVNAKYENFSHNGKFYINYNTRSKNSGYCVIKDIIAYRRALTDEEIVKNGLYYQEDLRQQELDYNFEFNNSTLPQIRMYLSEKDLGNMTLEQKVTTRVKYVSTNTEKYGQSFDLPYCQVGWQGTSSIAYVLKNFQVYMKDNDMNDYFYSPYPNGIEESTYCFKADYMESSHGRNVGLARIANDIIFADVKNPAQLINPKVRNAIDGFPALLYINDTLQGVYDFNTDRYSNNVLGYTDEEKHLSYEIAANSETTAGAFNAWSSDKGVTEINYYKSDFMCLYPPTRAAGNDNYNEIKRVVEFVDKSSDEDFKDNFERYFNKKYVLRYLIFVQLFALVDNLGKNMKLTSWDGGNIWYIQPYDCDTCIGLDNIGVKKFDSDVEIGDPRVFNTTNSKLWEKTIRLFDAEIRQEYALLRNGELTLENVLKYLIDDQISKIPAMMYNKDMQTKYLNFGESYLYALHGSSEDMIRRFMEERFAYVDSLYGYDTDSLDYVTIRCGAIDTDVFIDVQTFVPMYFKIKWENSSDGSGEQRLRIRKDANGNIQPVRFSHHNDAPDQEILLYGGKYIKNLGDLTNVKPVSLIISNATKLTKIECHSEYLTTTDLSECTNLVKVDLSDCTSLGSHSGTQSIVNVAKCKNLLYLNCKNTAITGITIDQTGSSIQEIYYPVGVKTVKLNNCPSLKSVGLPIDSNCNTLELIDCPKIESFGDREFNPTSGKYKYSATHFLKNVRELYLDNAYINGKETLWFDKMDALRTLTIKNSDVLKTIKFNGLNLIETYDMSEFEVTQIADRFSTKIIPYKCDNLKNIYFTDSTKVSGSTTEFTNNSCYSQGSCFFNALDLSETKIENLYIYSGIICNKLLLPTTLKVLIENPMFDAIDLQSTTNILNLYNSTGWLNWTETRCKGGTLIFKLTTDESNLTGESTGEWNFENLNLSDLYIFRNDIFNIGSISNDIYLPIVKNLNYAPNNYILPVENVQYESVNLDLSNFKGNSFYKAFCGFKDTSNNFTISNIDKINYDDIKVFTLCLKDVQTNQIGWDLFAKMFANMTNYDDLYKLNGIQLREQVDESEAIDLVNEYIYNGYLYGHPVFKDCNLKYINTFKMHTTYCNFWFSNNKYIESINNFILENDQVVTRQSYALNLNNMFENSTLKRCNVVSIDYQNLTDSVGVGLFSNCQQLSRIDSITLKAPKGSVQLDNMFKKDTSLTSLPSLTINCLNFSMYYSFAYTNFNTIDLSNIDMNKCTSLHGAFSHSTIDTLKFTQCNFESLTNMQETFNTSNINNLIGMDFIGDKVTNMPYCFSDSTINSKIPTPRITSSCINMNRAYSNITIGDNTPKIDSTFVVPQDCNNLTGCFASSSIFPDNFVFDASKCEVISNMDVVFERTNIKKIKYILPKKYNNDVLEDDEDGNPYYTHYAFFDRTENLNEIVLDTSKYIGTKCLNMKYMLINNASLTKIYGLDFDATGGDVVHYNTYMGIEDFSVYKKAKNVDINIKSFRMSKDLKVRFINEALDNVTDTRILTMSLYNNKSGTKSLTEDDKNELTSLATAKGWSIVFAV